jgi:hypothetical protein
MMREDEIRVFLENGVFILRARREFWWKNKAGFSLLLLLVTGSLIAAENRDQHQSTDATSLKMAGRVGSATRQGESMKDLAEQQERALQLLDQLLALSRDFKDEAFKIRVQAQIASLLWDYDQERARRYLEESFRASDSISGAGPEDGDKSWHRIEARRLRSEVLGMLARHADPRDGYERAATAAAL